MVFANYRFKLLTLLLVCLILNACTSESEKQARLRASKGNPSTALKPPPANVNPATLGWQLNDGMRQSLADYRGKALILDFWATYCPPCIEGIPHLNELKKRYEAEGLQIVGLNVGGEEDKPKIPDFVQKLQISYPLGYPERQLTDFYFQGDSRIPQTLVFDRNGQLVDHFVGFNSEIRSGIDKAVSQALQTQ